MFCSNQGSRGYGNSHTNENGMGMEIKFCYMDSIGIPTGFTMGIPIEILLRFLNGISIPTATLRWEWKLQIVVM